MAAPKLGWRTLESNLISANTLLQTQTEKEGKVPTWTQRDQDRQHNYLPEAAEMQQVVVNTGLQGEGQGGNMPAAEEENDCWEEQRKSFAAMCVKIQGYLEQSRR